MRHFDHTRLLATEELVESPAPRACEDQSFELPTGIYAAMALMFTGFVTVLGTAFSEQMAVSLGVIFTFLTAFFGIPFLFIAATPNSRTSALGWHRFVDQGIETATGRASARSAVILVLLLPFLIFCFAVSVAMIAAVV